MKDYIDICITVETDSIGSAVTIEDKFDRQKWKSMTEDQRIRAVQESVNESGVVDISWQEIKPASDTQK